MICMIRHGQTDQNKLMKIQGQSDFNLNETGLAQADIAGRYIKENYHFDLIITSPLSRALQTAQRIKEIISNEGHELQVIIDERFIERAFGEAEGCDICESVFAKIYKDDVKGLEKSYDLQDRITNALIDLFKKYPDKNILIVSHSHAIKAAITKLIPELDFSMKLDNCCLNIFEYDNYLKVIDYNINPIKKM